MVPGWTGSVIPGTCPPSGQFPGFCGSSSSWTRFFGILPLYGFKRNPLTHFPNISPANVPSWYEPLYSFVIQKGPVHRNRSFPSMLPIRAWNTRTSFPILNSFSLALRCRSTNAFRLRCSSSSCNKLDIRFSSNLYNVASRIFSDSFSLRRSLTWIRKLGIWNSTGITASNPNANQDGVVQMLVLYVVVWFFTHIMKVSKITI